jgi:hypothetical protein
VLFPKPGEKDKTFSSTPVHDWSNIAKMTTRHVKEGATHHTCANMAENFLAIAHNERPDVLEQANRAHRELVDRNRGILLAILDVIVLCGKQNLPLRGHNIGDGNFESIVQFKAKDNAELAHHLAHCSDRAKYTSPDIQNELIEIGAQQILQSHIQACNDAPCFAFIADECTDTSRKEQIALCVRFWDENKHAVREEFLGYVEAKKTTGEQLAETFIENLQNLQIHVNKMRGQGYDGAGNMSGIHRGVQARIRRLVPDALYVHCKAHCLNLSIMHACTLPLIRNTMDTVQHIAFAFHYSAKRLVTFKEQLQQDEVARGAMDDRTKLQNLCETRWYSRPDSLFTFKSCLTTVCNALEVLEEDGDASARSYRRSVQSFDFIVTLVTSEHILRSTVQLSLLLQAKSCDLLEAVKESTAVINMLRAERNDDAVWEALYEEATELAARLDVEPSRPRQARRQQHRANVPAESVSEYWRRAMYYPFVDHLVQEMETRLIQPQDRFLAQIFIPSRLDDITEASIRQVHDAYATDMTGTVQEFQNEVQRWVARWNMETVKPDTLADTLRLTNKQLYPNVYVALVILLTMPVSSCTAERAFSVMKRVKNYLRANMATERMSSLAILHAYKDFEIDLNRVIDDFAAKKTRRLAFVFNPVVRQ